MNEYLKNRLSRIRDDLYLSLVVINYVLLNDQISIGLAHELSRLFAQMDRESHLKQDLKEAGAEAYRLAGEGGLIHE